MVQLRQGQARRLVVKLRPVHNSGQLPLMLEEVVAIEVGGIVSRNKLQRPLDSYQEEDLTTLRDVWGETVEGMKERLDDQIHDLAKKGEKNGGEAEERHRKLEQSLIERKNCIMEELNQAVVPRPPSRISEVLLSGMERRAPVLFLHTSTLDSRDDLTQLEEHLPTIGDATFLPKESGGEFHTLPLLNQGRAGEVGAAAAWDSSVHGSMHLNRVTPDHEQLTMVVKVIVRLSEPYPLDLVLKKRVAFTVYKRKSIVNFFRRTVAVRVADAVGQPRPVALRRVGVTYELVGDVPKVFQRVEDGEEVDRASSSTGGIDENLLEQYTAAITSVETILALERMRQADMVIELDARKQEEDKARSGTPLKKTVSVPNIRAARSSLSLAGTLAGSSHNLSGSHQSLAAIKSRRSLPPNTAAVERQQKRLSLPSVVGRRSAYQANGSIIQQGTIVEEGDFEEGEK